MNPGIYNPELPGAGEAAYLAYMICSAVRTWDKACCLARFPSSDRRILAREGRFGLALPALLILLLAADESASEGTPKKRKRKFGFNS